MEFSADIIFRDMYLVKPELTIAVFMALALALDLFKPAFRRYLPLITSAAIIIASWFVIDQYTFQSDGFSGGVYGAFTVDPFSNFFKLIILLASLLYTAFTTVSIESKSVIHRSGEHHTLFLGMLLGMMALVSASDLLLLYVAVELLSLCAYVLTGFVKDALKGAEASLKYLIYGAAASGILLFGLSLLYGTAGSTNLHEIHRALLTSTPGDYPLLFMSVLLIVTGLGYKIAAAPFHYWAPDIFEGAPAPFTALLATASKAAGFAVLIRLIYTTFTVGMNMLGEWQSVTLIGWESLLLALAVASMTIGNLTALWQKNIKRMLAYSSIAHVGYMLAALTAFSSEGLASLMFYMIVYLFMTMGAFFIIILVRNKTGSEEIADYAGLGRVSPIAGVMLGLFLVSLIGLPPTAGFIGKFYIVFALINGGEYVLTAVLLINTVISVYYYMRVLKVAFFRNSIILKETFTLQGADIALMMLIALPLLFFGIYFTPVFELVKSSLAILAHL